MRSHKEIVENAPKIALAFGKGQRNNKINQKKIYTRKRNKTQRQNRTRILNREMEVLVWYFGFGFRITLLNIVHGNHFANENTVNIQTSHNKEPATSNGKELANTRQHTLWCY